VAATGPARLRESVALEMLGFLGPDAREVWPPCASAVIRSSPRRRHQCPDALRLGFRDHPGGDDRWATSPCFLSLTRDQKRPSNTGPPSRPLVVAPRSSTASPSSARRCSISSGFGAALEVAGRSHPYRRPPSKLPASAAPRVRGGPRTSNVAFVPLGTPAAVPRHRRTMCTCAGPTGWRGLSRSRRIGPSSSSSTWCCALGRAQPPAHDKRHRARLTDRRPSSAAIAVQLIATGHSSGPSTESDPRSGGQPTAQR